MDNLLSLLICLNNTIEQFKAERKHIDESVLDTFLTTAKYLLSSPTGIPLLKQLFDHILFNPGLWIHTDPQVPQTFSISLEWFSN